MYLIDTDIIIYSLKGVSSVVENFHIHSTEPKAISVITYGELIYGAEKSQNVSKNLAKVHRLREIFPIIEVSCSIMDTFGRIKSGLASQGITVNNFDLLIASTAITLGYTVVSNNEKHFRKIPELQLENWMAS